MRGAAQLAEGSEKMQRIAGESKALSRLTRLVLASDGLVAGAAGGHAAPAASAGDSSAGAGVREWPEAVEQAIRAGGVHVVPTAAHARSRLDDASATGAALDAPAPVPRSVSATTAAPLARRGMGAFPAGQRASAAHGRGGQVSSGAVGAEMCASALHALAVLCSSCEANRATLLGVQLPRWLRRALTSEHASVRRAAVLCAWALSRSTPTLRSRLVEAGIVDAIAPLLHDSDRVVVLRAVSLVCNLVVDFAPVKAFAIDAQSAFGASVLTVCVSLGIHLANHLGTPVPPAHTHSS